MPEAFTVTYKVGGRTASYTGQADNEAAALALAEAFFDAHPEKDIRKIRLPITVNVEKGRNA